MAKGLLMQRKGPIGVVMTEDGRFVRMLLRGKGQSLGQEVEGTELRIPSLKQGMAVASLMMVLLIGLWANLMARPAAAAYVALDINPSLELTVNREGTVIEAVGLDEEGRQLLKVVSPNKKELYQAVGLLIQGAAQQQYINDTNNVVLATVTSAQPDVLVVDEEKLQTTVQETVGTLAKPVKVVTERASLEEHQRATEQGVSVGRYLIHVGSPAASSISLDEVKHKGLGQLEKEKGIEIQKVLPHAKVKVTVVERKNASLQIREQETTGQFQHVPPGQLKKSEPVVDVKVLEPKKPEHAEGKGNRDAAKDHDRDDDEDNIDKDDDAKRRDDRRHSSLDQQDQTNQPAQQAEDQKEKAVKNKADKDKAHKDKVDKEEAHKVKADKKDKND